MIYLLKLLLLGHIHKWKILEQRPLGIIDTQIRGTRFILQCEHCGNVKSKDIT